jgi:hypothetical protein
LVEGFADRAETVFVPASNVALTVTCEKTTLLLEYVWVPDVPATLTVTGTELPNTMLRGFAELAKYCPQNGFGLASVSVGLTESTHTSTTALPTERLRSVTTILSSVGVVRLNFESTNDSGNVRGVLPLLMNDIRLPPEQTGDVLESAATVTVAAEFSVLPL